MEPSKLHAAETTMEGSSVADAIDVDLNTRSETDGMQPVVTDEFLPASEESKLLVLVIAKERDCVTDAIDANLNTPTETDELQPVVTDEFLSAGGESKLHLTETAQGGDSIADVINGDLSTPTDTDGMQPVATDEFMPGGGDPAAPNGPHESKVINQTDASATDEHKGGKQASNHTEKAEVTQPSGKRRGRPLGSTDTRPRMTKKLKQEDSSWEDLVSEVQQRLSAMDSDECFVKSIGIAMMARKQVESRSMHLVHAFDMLGKSSPHSSSAAAPHVAPHHTSAPLIDGKSRDPLESWMEKYMELKQFHHVYGHFNVPLDQPSYEHLGKWVQHQKNNSSTLDSTKSYLLRRINFPGWSHPKPKVLIDLTDHARPQKTKTGASPPAAKRSMAVEKGITTQKQVKSHRTTRFQTVEKVPCLKMPPPLPPKSDENEFLKQAPTPAFQAVVNFPNARFSGNCVMCDESDFPVPNQNKGVCNNCDSAVWVFTPAGIQVKWCKGCKNFRKWLDFGAKVRSTFGWVFKHCRIKSLTRVSLKGYSSKCQNCRTSQAQRYALSKKKNMDERQKKI